MPKIAITPCAIAPPMPVLYRPIAVPSLTMPSQVDGCLRYSFISVVELSDSFPELKPVLLALRDLHF